MQMLNIHFKTNESSHKTSPPQSHSVRAAMLPPTAENGLACCMC